MAGQAGERAGALLAACSVEGIGTVVDVGGGTGRLLAAVLAAHPHLRGILADRPGVVAGANAVLTEAGVADRCEVVSGDFFETVPGGGDAYVLAQILHDWPDEQALTILRNCASAMRPGARVWVIEQVLGDEPGATPAGVALLDLTMFLLFGARERARDEYCAMLRAAGFSDVEVHDTGTSTWRVIEGVVPGER